MSECQYYEFQAIDRPLTEKEMGELRSYSTRARRQKSRRGESAACARGGDRPNESPRQDSRQGTGTMESN